MPSRKPPGGGSVTPQGKQPRTTAGRRGGKYAHDPVSMGLRKLWQDIEQEPVPAEFLALLDAIDAASTEAEAAQAAEANPIEPRQP